MNNIFLPNDPLLYGQQADYKQLYEQKLMKERELFEKQYADYMRKPQQPACEDKITQLNTSLSNLTPEIKAELQKNEEFIQLNQYLQESVQSELLLLVKNNINSNTELASNISRQIQLINELTNKVNEQERQNMAQINDYLKNYSSMTFDEYKKLKNL